MLLIRWVKIREHERGLLFRDRTFRRLLAPGRHLIVDPLLQVRVERASVRQVIFDHRDLEVIVRSGVLDGQAEVLDLGDRDRALVWVDGRFAYVLGAGLHVLWTAFHRVRIERVDAGSVRFTHPQLATILAAPRQAGLLEHAVVKTGHAGLLFVDGRLRETLEPGVHALWQEVGHARVLHLDLREQMLDIAGQDIMTSDKVTLRLNALVTFRVVDAARAATAVEDYQQALYREAQLVLRAEIGGRELDLLLDEKEAVAAALGSELGRRAGTLGLEVIAFGIRDVILPGEIRVLMNRVTEARKAAEANLIARREETAAMRSQANTARILAGNPTLMKLRELEVLEKVADQANLTVMLSETGLSDRVLKLV